MTATSDAARALGRRRWACSTAAERKAFSEQGAAKGGASAWAGMTEAERSAEMLRRAAKRKTGDQVSDETNDRPGHFKREYVPAIRKQSQQCSALDDDLKRCRSKDTKPESYHGDPRDGYGYSVSGTTRPGWVRVYLCPKHRTTEE